MASNSITFVGDVAVPSKVSPKLETSTDHFSNTTTVANIEGDIVEKDTHLIPRNILFNHHSVSDFFDSMNISVANLANNHILDVYSRTSQTIDYLSKKSIVPVGAGDNIGEASQIKTLKVNRIKYAFLSFGWKVIGAQQAQLDSPGVNPLYPSYVLRMVEYARNSYPDHNIVVNFHWNYNLELHPQPLHRKLAYMAVDRGADLIIGHHPHIVSGIETYRSTPIVHSLGNWFIPHGVYFDGDLTYPEISTVHLAAEWNPEEELQLHWYQYESTNHSLSHFNSELLSESNRIEELTPYSKFTHQEYIKWFRQNRRIRSFLPVYVEPEEKYINGMKNKYCKYRQYIVDKIASIS